MADPPPVAPPVPPNDPNVPLPTAPVFPPTVNNVLATTKYRRNLDVSIDERPPGIRRTQNDRDKEALAVARLLEPPPWFKAAMEKFRANCLRNDIRDDTRGDILPDLKRPTNQRSGEGNVVPVPFTNGADPTQPADNQNHM